MLPIADSFNFVVCGFATLAATVGYAYTRKTRPLPSRGVPQPQQISGDHNSNVPAEASNSMVLEKPIEPENLHGGSVETLALSSSMMLEKAMDEGDSHGGNVKATPTSLSSVVLEKPMDEDSNGVAIAPESIPESIPTASENTTALCKHNSLKRKRTHELDEPDPDMGYPHNLSSIYPNKRRSGSVSEEESMNDVKEMVSEPCDSSKNEEPLPMNTSEPASSLPPKSDDVEGSSSPEILKLEPAFTEEPKQGVVIPESPKPLTDVPRFAFPKTPPRITHFPSPRTTTSPGFANFGGSSSPFFQSTSLATKPIWASPSTGEEASAACSDGEQPASALAAAKTSTLAVQPYSTGEEDEDVALELKGVKLYIKRGEDNFSGGMMGHIKLLSHKTTSARRLLFRREPLWKVSMNVRMQPTVRCTFDAQENILRVALKELPEKTASEEAAGPQTVIYAFKPSRSCRRSDFQDFAEALLAQARQGDQS